MEGNEGFKLYEFSCLEGNSGYNFFGKSVDNFISDNFYKGESQINCFHKFPIGKKKIFSAKKRHGIIDKEQINIINNRRKRNHYYTHIPNKKEFKTLNKTHSKYQINIIEEKNDNENGNNFDILSFDSSQDLFPNSPNHIKYRMKSPNFFRQLNSGMTNRIKTTRLIKPHKTNMIKSLSFINFLPNNNNKNKKNSISHTPDSTMVKTKLKNSTIISNNNSENESVSNDKEKNIGKKIRNLYTLKLFEEKKNNFILDDDLIMFANNKLNHSERRHLRQKIKLNNLLSEISMAKKNDVFKPNELRIKSNVNILTKFKRDLFKKRIKSASKNNLFFFKTRSNINKFERLSQKKEKRKIPHQNMCDKKSKKLLKNLEKLNIYTNREKNNFKKNEIKIDINNIKYFSKHFEEKKHFDKKIDEQFKKNVVEYQKEIGKFFIYKGNWIYSSHLNTLLKGDKIAQNIVKFDNL